jgi:chromosome segregation ATPase
LEALQNLDANSSSKIQSLLEQRKKELDKIERNNDRLKNLEFNIEEATKAVDNIKRRRLIEEDKVTKERKDDNRKLDEYRLKFNVEMMNEEDAISQLDIEMEEFYKLLGLQIKELQPVRQRLIDKITEIVKQYNPLFEVIYPQTL